MKRSAVFACGNFFIRLQGLLHSYIIRKRDHTLQSVTILSADGTPFTLFSDGTAEGITVLHRREADGASVFLFIDYPDVKPIRIDWPRRAALDEAKTPEDLQERMRDLLTVGEPSGGAKGSRMRQLNQRLHDLMESLAPPPRGE